MTTYMGAPSNPMVPVPCLTSLSMQPEREISYRTNLGGHIRAYTPPPVSSGGPMYAPRRQWSASIDTGAYGDVGSLVEFERQGQPLRFVGDAAAVSNVLSPDAAAGVGWSNRAWGGTVTTADGVAVSSFASTSAGDLTSPLFPVVPGLPVPAAIYGNPTTSANFYLEFRDLAGSAVFGGGYVALAAGFARTTITALAPVTAHQARLRVAGLAAVTRPTVTWTPTVQQWSPGLGADAVLLSPVRHDVQTAWADNQRAGFDYTITEVG